MLKPKALRDQTQDELEAQTHDIDKELFQLRNTLKVERKLEKPHKIKELKKDKAKILTVLTEKRKK